jgi:aspartate-semialdehyde dehydrogenase
VEFRGRHIPVIDCRHVRFRARADRAVLGRREVSREYAPKAAAAGCIVIDNTSEFRYEDDIPLVVPEVNPRRSASTRNAASSPIPNCSTIQMVVALKPIHDAVGITRINVATYQSVSAPARKRWMSSPRRPRNS